MLRIATLALLLCACAGPGSEIHVGPVYQRLSTAGGGVRSEGLFGAWQQERRSPEAPPRWHALLPLWSWRDHRQFDELTHIGGEQPDEKFTTTWLLPPLGRTLTRNDDRSSYFVPLYLHSASNNELYGTVDHSSIIFPGFLVKYHDGELATGWFPFLGVHDELMTFQDVTYVLFPLYLRAYKDGRVSRHFFFPILGWTTGHGEESFRLWPLYGRSKIKGRYDRRFFLWPIFQKHESYLSGHNEVKETTHTVFPLLGHTQRGSYTAWTWLWPFFGYARDPESGFWALDAFWPLVRFQRGGRQEDAAERSRIWPLYGRFVSSDLRSTSVAFPLIHHRVETYESASRETRQLFPFYRAWDRIDYATGEESSWRHYWPLFQRHENVDGETRTSFPALSPLERSRFMNRHYAWLWELYTLTEHAGGRSARSWGGLWRRESDELEDRRSFAGLWAQRRLPTPAGETSETSLLFGLLRWRSTPSGRNLMAPAFPGPGWPLERGADVAASSR